MNVVNGCILRKSDRLAMPISILFCAIQDALRSCVFFSRRP